MEGVTILQPATVEDAFRNQIGDLDFPAEIKTADPASTADFNAGPGYKWGLGLLLNTDAGAGHARGRAAEPGPGCSTPTSGSTRRPA